MHARNCMCILMTLLALHRILLARTNYTQVSPTRMHLVLLTNTQIGTLLSRTQSFRAWGMRIRPEEHKAECSLSQSVNRAVYATHRARRLVCAKAPRRLHPHAQTDDDARHDVKHDADESSETHHAGRTSANNRHDDATAHIYILIDMGENQSMRCVCSSESVSLSVNQSASGVLFCLLLPFTHAVRQRSRLNNDSHINR